MWTVPKQPRALTLIKYVVVAVSSVLLALVFVRIAVTIGLNPNRWLVLSLVFGLLAGYALADLVTGTTHWFCDTFFDGETPVIGQTVIQPFRDHHTYPQRITQYKFVEQGTSGFFLMLPVLAYLLLQDLQTLATTGSMFGASFFVGLSIGLFLTNVFHKWAHADHVSRPVKVLQKAGLILAPAHHRRHHRDYQRGFCVTSGWLNPTLDSVQFFPRLEIMARAILKRPKKGRNT